MLTNIQLPPATNKPTDSDMLAIRDNISRPTALKGKGLKPVNAEKIDETANEFEAQFISQMLSSMYATVDTQEGLGASDAEDVYNSMLTNEYGKIIARTGGVGVADQVKRVMIRQQEVE